MTATFGCGDCFGHGTVLHVIHGLGSGVEGVVADYVNRTPEYEHHVLFTPDPTCHDVDWQRNTNFASVVVVPQDLRGFRRSLTTRLKHLEPSIVHAHSSVAGVAARIINTRIPVVYTPHCYAFVRRDVSRTARAFFWIVEAALAWRTAMVAACSPLEAHQARRLPGPSRACYVPNVVSPTMRPTKTARRPAPPNGNSLVVACGRVSAQKDPHSFALAAAHARDKQLPIDFCWIGTGEPDLCSELEDAGVVVTGWLTRREAIAKLSVADAYVHAALWEAAPLTIIEAAELEVPVLARANPALDSFGLNKSWSTTSQLIDQLSEVLSGKTTESYSAANARIRRAHSPDQQRISLMNCYQTAQREYPRFMRPPFFGNVNRVK